MNISNDLLSFTTSILNTNIVIVIRPYKLFKESITLVSLKFYFKGV